MAIERATSKAKIEVISRGGHLACKVLRVVESLILVSVLNRFLVHELVSRLMRTSMPLLHPQALLLYILDQLLELAHAN